MLTLYQFPISHYCEKIRWVLDYKQLKYEVNNLLVGQHRETILEIAPRSSVPVLVHEKQVIQNSSDIVSYLEKAFPDRSLKPDAEEQIAIEWERFIDDELGVDLRCLWYHHLLDRPDLVVPLFTMDGPEQGPAFYEQAFPQLQQRMREFMSINDTSAKEAEIHLQAGIDRLQDVHRTRQFILGSSFSRVDIAAAAILSPLALKDQTHGLSGTSELPEPLQSFVENNWHKTEWIRESYNRRN